MCCTAAASGSRAAEAPSTRRGTATAGTRTASLREGATYQVGQNTRTVKPSQETTLPGHVYMVSKICSYRVVLEPKDAKDRAKAAAAPKSLEPVGGPADDALCCTTNPTVRAAASEGFPPKGNDWVLTTPRIRRPSARSAPASR
ncbi:hypothetical protein [Streptomyces sp. NPDC005322]|uniref:hypothetical protein n=1 Tax=Streptomyces sp. NPDC005322 TaxID=3157032 RepID=UPI00339F7766